MKISLKTIDKRVKKFYSNTITSWKGSGQVMALYIIVIIIILIVLSKSVFLSSESHT